jgi:hypothetical protein
MFITAVILAVLTVSFGVSGLMLVAVRDYPSGRACIALMFVFAAAFRIVLSRWDRL